MFRKNDKLFIKAYTYVNYASLIVDRRFSTDYCTLFRGNLVIWRNKKQNVVARSITD